MSTTNTPFLPIRERIRKVTYDYTYGSPDRGPDDSRESRIRKLRDATKEAIGHHFVALYDLEVEELPKVYRAVCAAAGVHCDLDKPTSRIAEMADFTFTNTEMGHMVQSSVILRTLADFNEHMANQVLADFNEYTAHHCTEGWKNISRSCRERAELLREHAAFIEWHQMTGTPLP